MYDSILKRMPSLKQITLDIPERFEDTGLTHLSHADEHYKTVHLMVEMVNI
jgi:hypothetical protein